MSTPAPMIQTSFPPITRTTLALYGGAAGDVNPVHLDLDVARAAGFDDVFAQGMLVMAYLGRAVTDAVSPGKLRSLSTRFAAITQLGDTLTCTGIRGEDYEADGERRFDIELTMRDQNGDAKLLGRATCACEGD